MFLITYILAGQSIPSMQVVRQKYVSLTPTFLSCGVGVLFVEIMLRIIILSAPVSVKSDFYINQEGFAITFLHSNTVCNKRHKGDL